MADNHQTDDAEEAHNIAYIDSLDQASTEKLASALAGKLSKWKLPSPEQMTTKQFQDYASLQCRLGDAERRRKDEEARKSFAAAERRNRFGGR